MGNLTKNNKLMRFMTVTMTLMTVMKITMMMTMMTMMTMMKMTMTMMNLNEKGFTSVNMGKLHKNLPHEIKTCQMTSNS